MYGSRRHRGGRDHTRQAPHEPSYTVEDPDENPIPVHSEDEQNEADASHFSGDQHGHPHRGPNRRRHRGSYGHARQTRNEQPYTVEDRDGSPIPVDSGDEQTKADTGHFSDDQHGRLRRGPNARRHRMHSDSRRGTHRRGSLDDAHPDGAPREYDTEEPGYSSHWSGYETSDSEAYAQARQDTHGDRYQYSRRRRHGAQFFPGSLPDQHGMREERPYPEFDDRFAENVFFPEEGDPGFEEYLTENFRPGTAAYENRRARAYYNATRDLDLPRSRRRSGDGSRYGADTEGPDPDDALARNYARYNRRRMTWAYRHEQDWSARLP